MRKWLVTVLALGLCRVPLRADITVTQSITMEGMAAVLMPDGQLPRITIRIKGMKARTDIETFGQTDTAITDVETRQVMMLRAGSKIAQVITPQSVAASAPSQARQTAVSLKPTGRSRTINGVSCAEHSFMTSLDMASVPNPHIPPEAVKGVRMLMNGSIWIAKSAPGAAEWMAFHKAALESELFLAITGVGSQPGMNKLLASATAAGIPCLTEMTMRYEGGSGPMVDVMKQMGDMKMVQKVTAVSTELIADDLFKLPAGYTIKKR